jgi:2,4-dienoyl-CoA reductase-like NADH-dependent reductase (Old Yellow Enzyme family)
MKRRPALFEPVRVGSLELSNRIVIAPMCQYSAENGCMNDWHLIHLGHLSISGAALLTVEATAVLPDGRITWADVGLWSDETEMSMSSTLDRIRRWSGIPIGIQLNHAGRKASAEVPWVGGAQIASSAPHGWQTEAPSSIPYAEGQMSPQMLDRDRLRDIRDAFVSSAKRARRIGLDLIQLHCAHGYLLHQFLSPLSNQRDDTYGGSLENRMRFPLEVFEAVRQAIPDRPVTVRISGTDWVDGGWDIEQTCAFAAMLEAAGCDAFHISSGGLHPAQRIPVGPSYQVPLARAVKTAVGIPVVAVGLITGFDQAEAIVATREADMVALARTILYDPRWPWHAAAELGAQVQAPHQYLRSQPRRFRDLLVASSPKTSEPSSVRSLRAITS